MLLDRCLNVAKVLRSPVGSFAAPFYGILLLLLLFLLSFLLLLFSFFELLETADVDC